MMFMCVSSATTGTPLTEEAVRQSTETLIKERFDVDMSLDVENVLPVLLEWGLVQQRKDGLLTCLTLADGLARLDEQWDSLFSYQAKPQGKRKPAPMVAQEVASSNASAQPATPDGKFSIAGLLRKRRSSVV